MNFLRELNAQRVTSVVLAGLITGIVTLISSVSFAALHKFMIRVITRRLLLTTSTLQAVLT